MTYEYKLTVRSWSHIVGPKIIIFRESEFWIHLWPLLTFPGEIIEGFLMFSGGIEWEHRSITGWAVWSNKIAWDSLRLWFLLSWPEIFDLVRISYCNKLLLLFCHFEAGMRGFSNWLQIWNSSYLEVPISIPSVTSSCQIVSE